MVICNKSCKNDHHTPRLEWILLNIKGGMISSTNIDKIQQLLATYLFGRLYDESTCRLLWSHFTCSAYSLAQINSSENFHKNVTWENMFFVTSEFFFLLDFLENENLFCWVFQEDKNPLLDFSENEVERLPV